MELKHILMIAAGLYAVSKIKKATTLSPGAPAQPAAPQVRTPNDQLPPVGTPQTNYTQGYYAPATTQVQMVGQQTVQQSTAQTQIAPVSSSSLSVSQLSPESLQVNKIDIFRPGGTIYN
jgi:hypothetical protein